MATGMTKTTDLVLAQVIADGIKSNLGKVKFAPVAFTQDFSNQQAGTIVVPTYAYVGDADIVPEGTPMDLTKMSQTSAELAIKKAGKAVELTDEARRGAIGDPVAEVEAQLTASILGRIEADLAAALATSTQTATGNADYAGIIAGQSVFGENADQPFTIFANPADMVGFGTDKTVREGNFNIVYTTKVEAGTFYLVQDGALGLYFADKVEVETDRDVLVKSTVFAADALYATHLRDASKVVKVSKGE